MHIRTYSHHLQAYSDLPPLASDQAVPNNKWDHHAAAASGEIQARRRYLMDNPMRLRSLKFHQIMKAFPTMLRSGTNPQYRLSLLLSRLSPMVK
jgi:hypothetical protein